MSGTAGSEDTVQAAACVGCGQSWLMPDALPDEFKDRYPLETGPWENPCPDCGGTIWVAEPISRQQFDALADEAAS